MIIHTGSEGITMSKKLENDSAGLYEKMAQLFENDSETFLSFISENKKYSTQVERAYYGVITDAIEGCFAFNLDTEKYALELDLPDGASHTDAVQQAIDMEKKIIEFYEEAAEQSRALLADVPRAFIQIAKKRKSRIEKLGSLIKN
jgi:rubrerythrin